MLNKYKYIINIAHTHVLLLGMRSSATPDSCSLYAWTVQGCVPMSTTTIWIDDLKVNNLL